MMTPNIIPYGKQNITQEDINAVVEVLKSDYLTQGPKIEEFENVIYTELKENIGRSKIRNLFISIKFKETSF